MKKRNFYLLMLLFISILTSCNPKRQKLEEQVKKYNTACPIPLGGFMTLNSIVFEDDTVTMKITADDRFISIDALKSHEEDAKEILGLGVSKGTSVEFIDLMIESNTVFNPVFINNKSGTRASLKITPIELKRTKEKFQDLNDGQKTILSNVLGIQLRLPMQIDDITTLKNLVLTENSIRYEFELNDKELGDMLESTNWFLKKTITSEMNTNVTSNSLSKMYREFYKALVDNHHDMKLEYREVNTGKYTTFVITTSEIQDILNGDYKDKGLTIEDMERLGEQQNNINYQKEIVVEDNKPKHIVLYGSVGRYNVRMTLSISDEQVSGSYYYTNSGDGSALYLSGKMDENGHLYLYETNAEGFHSGTFQGLYIDDDSYVGSFTNYKNEEMNFSLIVKK